MLTCSQTITGSMRKLGVLPIGRSAAAAQAEDALEVLTSLYLELIGQGVFGSFIDTLVTATTYEIHEGERVTCSAAVTTVTFPTSITTEWCPSGGPIGGYTDYGWSNSTSFTYPRPPRDNAIAQVAYSNTNATTTKIYDAPRATWQTIGALTLTDNAPLSDRYGEAMKAKLAEKLAPHFNVQPNPFLIKEIATANSLLSTRYDRAYRPVSGAYF